MDGLQYFFSASKNVPDQYHTGTFTPKHFLAIGVVLVIMTVLTLIFKNKSEKTRRIFIIVCAFLIPTIQACNLIWLSSIGEASIKTDLPLHLCGVMYVVIPVMVLTKNKYLKEFVYACGMPGALMAILTPDSGDYFIISYGYLQFMLIHMFIFYVPFFMTLTKEIQPRLKHIYRAVIPFLTLAVIDLIVDLAIGGGTNYLFLIIPSKGTLFENFAQWVPGHWYLALGALVVMTI